jgi:hypothetical protein
MNIGSLGIVGGLAASPLSQRTAETDRADREAADQAREAKTSEKAEQAAGIGQTEEDSGAQERDADGRRPWEHPAQPQPTDAEAAHLPAESSILAKDPSGERGSEIDLLG